VAAIIIASVPLLVAVLALRFDHAERATGSRLVGLLIGFTGVVVLVGIDVAGRGDELLGAAFILIASLGYAAGPMVLRRHLSDADQRAVMGVALAIAAVFLTPVTLVGLPSEMPSGDALLSIVVLGLLCTAAAFVVFGRLIAEIGPGRALVITYVNPVVALALGMAVLGEHPGAGAIAGLLLILAGSWLSTDGRLPPGLAGVVSRARRTPRRSRAPSDSRASLGSPPSPDRSPAKSS
jgi:drug/metabolite transporter (DMT)-like permease